MQEVKASLGNIARLSLLKQTNKKQRTKDLV